MTAWVRRLVSWWVAGLCLGCQQNVFDVVVLGGAGGLEEDNLSAYLVRPRGGAGWLALDAGTLRAGVLRAAARGTLKLPPGPAAADRFLREGIRAYALTHAHLDHISGLVINSTDDDAKPIFATPATLSVLRDSVFNWRLWPNFGDDGVAPLKRYRAHPLGEEPASVEGTGLTIEAYALSHGRPYQSSAFLVRSGASALLYVGDTGPDAVEGVDGLGRLWRAVAPLVGEGRLKAVFLECSFPEARDDAQLFGHLKPSWFMTELTRLASLVRADRPEGALAGLPVVVTHVKPGGMDGETNARLIMAQLAQRNTPGVRLLLAEPGVALAF